KMNWIILSIGLAILLSSAAADVSSIITKSMFEDMLKHRNDDACPAKGFYTYSAFLTATRLYPKFGNTGDYKTQKRELAAFFAQTSHETTERGEGDKQAWGYCLKEEVNPTGDYCDQSTSKKYPCYRGRSYHGRGPMQISYNYNYGQASRAIFGDKTRLLKNPELVSNDPVIAFKTAIWFWMTPQSPKPSCHDVVTERWVPSNADANAGRFPGFGVTTNIINGGLECGNGHNEKPRDRVLFNKRYCGKLGVNHGPNLSCYDQRPF
ncbi:glycoside hydrolase family 19 protein, partial [Aliarcobacter cryaerophilus]|uniref:glycoside hydrolase family 19 protein n=1 Tax=Aliarcobacter cryaerophilus TaxID=28198 RepID=UPI0021B6A62C